MVRRLTIYFGLPATLFFTVKHSWMVCLQTADCLHYTVLRWDIVEHEYSTKVQWKNHSSTMFFKLPTFYISTVLIRRAAWLCSEESQRPAETPQLSVSVRDSTLDTAADNTKESYFSWWLSWWLMTAFRHPDRTDSAFAYLRRPPVATYCLIIFSLNAAKQQTGITIRLVNKNKPIRA